SAAATSDDRIGNQTRLGGTSRQTCRQDVSTGELAMILGNRQKQGMEERACDASTAVNRAESSDVEATENIQQ
ncbi:MAG: hypothetical protein MUQ10_02040, partial [Anaerolineae bacterium]|nr:hypothetical protein [Anaerolineae bacterium]